MDEVYTKLYEPKPQGHQGNLCPNTAIYRWGKTARTLHSPIIDNNKEYSVKDMTPKHYHYDKWYFTNRDRKKKGDRK